MTDAEKLKAMAEEYTQRANILAGMFDGRGAGAELTQKQLTTSFNDGIEFAAGILIESERWLSIDQIVSRFRSAKMGTIK